MSHQDSHRRTSSPFNLQALKDAFLWLLGTSDLSAIRFRDDCTWSPLGLVFAALLWSWSGEKSLKDRFVQARKICFKALGRSALGTGAAKKAKAKKAKTKKAKAKAKKAKANKPASSYQAFMKL